MIEIIPEENIVDVQGYPVYLEGVLLSREQAHVWDFLPGLYELSVFDTDLKPKFSSLSCANLPPIIGRLELPGTRLFADFSRSTIEITPLDGEVIFAFFYSFDIGGWKNPWSIEEFQKAMEGIWDTSPIERVTLEMIDIMPRAVFTYRENDLSATIAATEERLSSQIKGLMQRTYDSLATKAHSDSLVTHFNFPEEKRVACEQYLLYFVQFLKDLGVDAKAELQSERGRVLFAVTPADQTEALDKIREALEIYLSLPFQRSGRTFGITAPEIEIQRLLANIQHLNGQLLLADAVFQAKNAAIQAQDVTIQQLQQGSVFTQALEQSTGDAQDKENLMGGLVSLKPLEVPGIDLNLPEIFRQLRRRFKR